VFTRNAKKKRRVETGLVKEAEDILEPNAAGHVVPRKESTKVKRDRSATSAGRSKKMQPKPQECPTA